MYGLLNTYTVSFFGHRQIDRFREVEQHLEDVVRELLAKKEYVEFLVGRNGEFDLLASSVVVRMKRTVRDDNSSLILVLPYMTAEYENNRTYFENYYDEVIVADAASGKHFKAAIQAMLPLQAGQGAVLH